MRLNLPIILSGLILSLFLISGVDAAVTYIPGPSIAMTGSNIDKSVRFDVASVLTSNGLVAEIPRLNTTTSVPTFEGAFYGSGIGWISFASGTTHQVNLICSEALNVLVSKCTLTGTGWSDNVGDIDFVHVRYNPATGLLEGTGGTWVGEIDLTGIALPLRPMDIRENGIRVDENTTLVANHSVTLTVSGAWIYAGGDKGWKLKSYINGSSRTSVGTDGIFDVDFSLATDDYILRVDDSNGSTTRISGVSIISGILSTTLDPLSTIRAKKYCVKKYLLDPVNCFDGSARKPTHLTHAPATGPVIANGTDTYTVTLGARDQYGNRVTTGMMRVTYKTTVKNIQVDPFSADGNINYGPSSQGDAFLSDTILPNPGIGKASTNMSVGSADINYTISSTAPSNTIDNVIKLDSVVYSSGGTDTTLLFNKTALIFAPLFTAQVSATSAPVINTPYTFTTDITGTYPGITPTIISTLQIGDGSSAEWRSLTSDPSYECVNYPYTATIENPCDWTDVSSIAVNSDIDFSFTGTYTSWLGTTDATTIDTYIYYTIGGNDVLYKTIGGGAPTSTSTSQRIQILGQSGEGVGGGTQSRVDLINSIRKQVALLSRNRTNYDTADYIVKNTDYTISNNDVFVGDATNKAKRTIIVIGGNITIDTDITPQDHPLALIALTDASGHGGNIIIEGDVTDINSSLVAEHAVTSRVSDSQLYILGSLVSANPPRETPPDSCPYFVLAGCIKEDYDIAGSRDGYAALDPTDKAAKSSAGGSTYPSPLVIQSDSRLARDPVPGMSK